MGKVETVVGNCRENLLEKDESLVGLEAKYSTYVVYHWKFNTERWWVFVPVLCFDTAMFIM